MKSFIFSSISVITVVLLYFIFVSHYFVVPFLWSMLLIYLYGKNHINIAINSFFILILFFIADRGGFDS